MEYLDPAMDLARMAYTLQTGREAMENRLAMVASNLDEVKEKLRQYEQGAYGDRGFFQRERKGGKKNRPPF